VLLAPVVGVVAVFIVCCSRPSYKALQAAHSFQIHRADSLGALLLRRSQERDSVAQLLQKCRLQILRERYINHK